MRKESENEVKGLRVKTALLPARTGVKVFYAFTQVVGAAFARGISAAESADNLSKMRLDTLADALERVFDKVGPDDVLSLCEKLLESTKVLIDGEWKDCTKDFDEIFAGRYRTLFDICAWVFEENFNEVFSFSVIAARFKSAMADVKADKSTSSRRSVRK